MRTVVITGGSRGIGAELCRTFCKDGYRVIFCYRTHVLDAEKLTLELKREGLDIEGIQVDISNREATQAFGKTVLKKLGHIDVLINNAGIAEQKLFQDITECELQNMFAVNVFGAFYMTQALVPDMIACQAGRIINISSMWGQVGSSCEVHYSASKAAVIGMTKALAKELGLSGITVNCIAPGVIDTDMNGHLDTQTLDLLKEETPLGRLGTPRDIAESALFLASKKAGFITGQVLGISGGFVIN